MRWEVSSLRSHHGSFVEAARVKPLAGQTSGEWWVERPVPELKPAHVARVQRRWWLAARVNSLAWPQVLDAGDEGGQPWAVVQTPGRRTDGTFPFADSQLALKAARGLALGVAEVEQLLAAHGTSPHVSVRPSMLACDDAGRLRFHLAALDAEPDQGFPTTPATWMWTGEELFGMPQSARSNVFALGWLLTLMLTGRAPYAWPAGSSEKAAKEALRPLVLGNTFAFSLPPQFKPVETVLRRALAWPPSQRFADAGAFSDALSPFAPGTPQVRAPAAPPPIAPPTFDARHEQLPPAVEAQLAQAGDESPLWADLAQLLAEMRSPRAKLMRGDASVKDELTPSLAGEQLTCEWKQGYVRALSVAPVGKPGAPSEQRTWELVGLFQHPSLRFVTDLTLAGPVEHAKQWLEVLPRVPALALKRVSVSALPPKDPLAVEIAFRFPKWAWTWGASPGLFKRLFG